MKQMLICANLGLQNEVLMYYMFGLIIYARLIYHYFVKSFLSNNIIILYPWYLQFLSVVMSLALVPLDFKRNFPFL